MAMVSCSEFLAEFGNYLEGDVGPELRRALEAHLSHCSSCRVIVDSTTKTLKIVTDAAEFDLSEGLPEATVSRIMDRVRAERLSGADDEDD